ncbi:MAG: FecR family protein [Planctomycetota bacterium]
MTDQIESLIEQHLEGSLDEAGQDKLVARLKNHPDDMQKFVEANIRDQMLRETALGEFLAQDVLEITPAATKSQSTVSGPRTKQLSGFIALAAAITACLLITFFWYQKPDSVETAIAEPFSSVAMIQKTTSSLRGSSSGLLKEGDRLAAESIKIESGFVRLLFDDGVEVSLQGPAEYELIAPGKTKLVSGLLTATVPPGAEGFCVDTPTAQVVDLGTAFGIEQKTDGTSKVSVFDGEVEVIGQNENGKRLLTEGQAIELGTDGKVVEAEFSTQQFEKLWPLASGIAGSTGAFEFAPQWPRMLKRVESDTSIFVLPEGYPKQLEEPCQLDMTEEGLSESFVPAGKRVRSFLLQFNPMDSGGKKQQRGNRKNFRRIKGSITFDRPVVGLILKTETLKKTDGTFSLNRAAGLFGRGLEFKPPRLADEISLSEDRKTLTLNLGVVDRLSDHVRVIVDAELNEAEELRSVSKQNEPIN